MSSHPHSSEQKKNWDKYISMKISTSTHPLLLQNPSVMIFKKSHEEFTDSLLLFEFIYSI